MDRGKSLIVALTRFYGIVMLFYGLFYATYLGPYYHRYIIVYENPATHAGVARMFWVEILHVVLRVLAGLILFAQAESIIDSLRPTEAEPGLKSLIVALVKLNGLILLFYGAINAIDLVPFFSNPSHVGLSAIINGAPEILRTGLNLLAGFLVVTCAEKFIDGLDRREPRKGRGDPAATAAFHSGPAGGET